MTTSCFVLRSTGPRLVSSSCSHSSMLELPALAARLVGGDLLEAVHQVGGAGEVAEEKLRSLAHALDEALEHGALQLAARRRLAEALRLVAEQRRGGERDAERRVDLMRDAGDELAERGELLRLDQVGLRLLQLGQARRRRGPWILRSACSRRPISVMKTFVARAMSPSSSRRLKSAIGPARAFSESSTMRPAAGGAGR